MKEQIENILSIYDGNSFELIPILQQVQNEVGFLPEPAMRQIAKFVNLPASRVYAVTTFYAQFRFTPMGKNKVTVCRGTACHVRGGKRVLEEIEQRLDIKEGETSEDLEYTLETAACIGCCALAPCIMVNDKVEAKMTPKKVGKVFAEEATDAE